MDKCYLYTNDGFYAGESMAYNRLPGNATFTPPPPKPWIKKWPRLVNGEWILEDDHRERTVQLFEEDAQEATQYWLPEDTWDSQPKTMTKPGPLPEGALLERPKKPEAEKLTEAKEAKLSEINQSYDAAMAASLTMPKDSPSPTDIAVGAALFANEDAEGLEYITAQHSQRRTDLESQVQNAESAEDVAAIKVSYAV